MHADQEIEWKAISNQAVIKRGVRKHSRRKHCGGRLLILCSNTTTFTLCGGTPVSLTPAPSSGTTLTSGRWGYQEDQHSDQ